MAVYPVEQLQNSLFLPTSTLAANMLVGDLTLSLAAGQGARIPSVGYCRIRIDDEILLMVSRSTDTLTVLRGQEGSVATSHAAGASVYLVITASALRNALVIPTQMVNGSWGLWTRGNGPFTADNAWSADGWRIDLNGTSTLQVDREFTITVGPWSVSGGKITYVQGTVASRVFNKHADFTQIRLRQVTFSHWAFSSVPNAVRLHISDGISVTYGSYHTGGGGWERLTVTKTIAETATTTEWGISFEASGTYYVDSGQWVFGPDAGDYLPPDPAYDGFRASLYCQRVDMNFSFVATAGGQDFVFPVPWKRAMGAITGTPNIRQVTAGTLVNVAATYPRVQGTDITGGATVATTSFGAYCTLRSSASGVLSWLGGRLEWEDNP